MANDEAYLVVSAIHTTTDALEKLSKTISTIRCGATGDLLAYIISYFDGLRNIGLYATLSIDSLIGSVVNVSEMADRL